MDINNSEELFNLSISNDEKSTMRDKDGTSKASEGTTGDNRPREKPFSLDKFWPEKAELVHQDEDLEMYEEEVDMKEILRLSRLLQNNDQKMREKIAAFIN